MKKLKMFYVVLFVCLFAFCGCGSSGDADLQKQMEELQKQNEEFTYVLVKKSRHKKNFS